MSQPNKTAVLNAIHAVDGDCFLLQFKVGMEWRYWLIDGGPGNANGTTVGTWKYPLNSLFNTLNNPKLDIKKLDRVIVTHADADHTEGVWALLNALNTKTPPDESTEARKKAQKYISWLNGYYALNPKAITPPTFPIGNFWYNDYAKVVEYKGNKATVRGWMQKLLSGKDPAGLSITYGSIADKIPSINEEWKEKGTGIPLHAAGTNLWPGKAKLPRKLKPEPDFECISRMLGPTDSELRISFDSKGRSLEEVLKKVQPMSTWWRKPASFIEMVQSEPAYINKYPSADTAWNELDSSEKQGVDNSVRNVSSIMFIFHHKYDKTVDVEEIEVVPYKDSWGAEKKMEKRKKTGKTTTSKEERYMMFTGDGTVDTLNYVLTEAKVEAREYDIIKLPHHGSCNNNVLHTDYEPGFPLSKYKPATPAKLDEMVLVWFTQYKAKKWVISSDTLQSSYNPDLVTLKGMAAAYSAEMSPAPERQLYAVNGVNWKGFKTLRFEDWAVNWDAPRHNALKIKALKDRATIDYGPIVPSFDDLETDEHELGYWHKIDDENDWGTYFIKGMQGMWERLWEKIGGGKPLNEKAAWEKIRERLKVLLMANPIESQWDFGDNPGKKAGQKTDIDAAEKKWASGTHMHTRRAVTALPQATSPSRYTWHDVMIANFLDTSRLSPEDFYDAFENSPPDATPYESLPRDGRTPVWVDLATYIRVMTEQNATTDHSGKQPYDKEWLDMITGWFTVTDDSGRWLTQDTILASMLLCALLAPDAATDLLLALPLNPHNSSTAFDAKDFLKSLKNSKTASDGFLKGASMMNMTVRNFRAKVLLPSPTESTDVKASKPLDVPSMYFELAAPPSDLGGAIGDAEFKRWTVPYRNGTWTSGNLEFKHSPDKPIRVQINKPLYQNAISYCHFNTTLHVDRINSEQAIIAKALPAKGTMYFIRGRPATYDIRLSVDETQVWDILSLVQIFSPTAASGMKMLETLSEWVEIPGIDLSKLKETFNLSDVGIVMQQHNVRMRSVAIESFYGTVDLVALSSGSSPVGLDKEKLPFPGGLEIPERLTSMSLQVTNLTGRDHKVTFALSHSVEGMGIVSIDATRGADSKTHFDILVITEADLSVAGVLQRLDLGPTFDQFKAAGILSGLVGESGAFAHLYVPFLHLKFTPGYFYAPSSIFQLAELTVAVNVKDISIPDSTNPVFVLENLGLEILHRNPTSSGTADLAVYATATAKLGGYDAIATFKMDHDNEDLAMFLATPDVGGELDAGDTPAPATAGAKKTTIDVSLDFPNEKPTIGRIIESFLNEEPDKDGHNTLSRNIPTDWLDVLLSTDIQFIQARLEKTTASDGTTNWHMEHLRVIVGLNGLQGIMNKLPPIHFDVPVLDVTIKHPSDPKKKAYFVYVSSSLSLGSGMCKIYANFSNGPGGKGRVSDKYMTVGLKAMPSHPGLPLGGLLDGFTNATLDVLDVAVQVPDNVKDVLNGVTIDEANITWVKVDKSWKINWFEADITSSAEISLDGWTPCDGMDIKISNARLHFGYDAGLMDKTPAKSSVLVEFDAKIKIGEMDEIGTYFTHNSKTGEYTFSLISKETIHVTKLIMSSLGDIGLVIPDDIEKDINAIFTVDTNAFYISYAKTPQYYAFSNDGSIRLFGLDISNLSVRAQKSNAGVWSWELTLALKTPCMPFASEFLGIDIPGLSDLVIKDGRFGLVKGSMASGASVMSANSTDLPDRSGVSLMLSGTISFKEGSDFMKFIGKVVQLPEIKFAMVKGGLTLEIPTTDSNELVLKVDGKNILAITGFFFRIQTGKGSYFGLGVKGAINASWLSPKEIRLDFKIVVTQPGGGIGASFHIEEIESPFNIPGLKLTDTYFELVWLAETETPQRLVARAGVEWLAPALDPKDEIKAGFDFRIDQLAPDQTYYKMDIENLTLPNVMKAFMNDPKGKVPKPFDSDLFNIGFKKLLIDLEPGEGLFIFKADVYFFGRNGKADVTIDKSKGVKAAAMLDAINIFELIKLHAYKDPKHGPWLFLNTTVPGSAVTHTKPDKPPAWLTATSIDDERLAHTIFGVSASFIFLGTTIDVFGLVDDKSLTIYADNTSAIDIDVARLAISRDIAVYLDKTHFFAQLSYKYEFGLHISDVHVFGVDIGGYNGSVVELNDQIGIKAEYTPADWEDSSLEFWVGVHAKILMVNIGPEKLTLDVTIKEIEDVPKAIEKLIEDKVVKFIKDEILGPIVEIGEKAIEAAKKTAQWLADEWNAGAHEVVSILTGIGHGIETIAGVMYNELKMGLDEIATALQDFGHEVNDVANALVSAAETAGMEVVSALMAAGYSVEHAVEAVFSEAAAEISKDISFIGNTVSSIAQDFVHDFEHAEQWFVSEVNEVESHLSDAGVWIEGRLESTFHIMGNVCTVT